MSAFVSFCMSTFQRPELLHKQLTSILQQQYTNFEIIVSDNDPERSAQSVVESIGDKRVLYFSNQENLGMIKSFNKSIERSGGQYIVMITDDDPVYPDMLTTLIKLEEQYPGRGVYSGCGDLIIENEFAAKTLQLKMGTRSVLLKSMKENEVHVINDSDFAAAYLEGFFSTTFLLWSCMMVRKEVLTGIKGIPDYGSELLGDHAYVIAVGSVDGMVYINKAVGGQVVHGKNFGYDIFKLKEKYINTPVWFYGYLRSQLQGKEGWENVEKKIWKFTGRSWVEYSLQIFNSLKDKTEKKTFFELFHLAFKKRQIHKWKYKFYLKSYFRPLFDVLLNFKRIW